MDHKDDDIEHDDAIPNNERPCALFLTGLHLDWPERLRLLWGLIWGGCVGFELHVHGHGGIERPILIAGSKDEIDAWMQSRSAQAEGGVH